MKKLLLTVHTPIYLLKKIVQLLPLFVILIVFIDIPVNASGKDRLPHKKVADKIISGHVRDVAGNPIISVNVTIKGSSAAGVITDEEGYYQINIPDDKAVLVFSHASYDTYEIAVGKSTTLPITLQSKNKSLSEVVVVGYGSKDKRSLTSSVSTIQHKNIKDIKATSFEQLLIGQAPGVLIQQSNGHPGSGLNIKIRGTGSISALNDPLYVIDGMPIEPPGYDSKINVLAFLNPSDIESITILKDAASTSIYGSRGSNGVVIVTTKTGKIGRTNIDVNVSYGLQTIPKNGRFKMMNAEEFAQFRIETLQDAAKVAGVPFDPNIIPPGYRNVTGEGTDWFSVVSDEWTPVQNYNITLRSGTAKARTMISTDYYSMKGNLKRTDFERISLRANVDVDITDKIKYGARINPSYSFRELGGARLEGFASIISINPISPLYLPDGTLNPVLAAAPENFVYTNPILRFNNVTDFRNDFRLLASNFLEIELLKGLTFKANVGGDLNLSNSRYFYPSFIGNYVAGSGGSIALPPGHASGSAARDQFTTWLVETYATYKKNFFQHHDIELMAGHTAQKQDYDAISVSGSRYPDDNIPYVVAAIPGDFRDGVQGSDNFRYSLESYYGRLNYSFKQKYFLNGTIRRDGTSRFSPSARWGVFPAVSAGWMLSEEKFMQSFSFINELKLRASYGVTGNNNIRSSFAYIPSLSRTTYVFGNALAQGTFVGFADQGLEWESNRETDIGLDMSVLNRRLNITVDWFRRVTYDLLLGRPIPTITGAGSIQTNIGSLENKGLEFGINSKNIQTRDLQWETGLNISINRNKVLSLNDNNDPIESGDPFQGSTLTEVGKPLGMFKGFVIDGIYATEEEAIKDHSSNPGAHAGTLKLRDLNGDGNITPADREVIGSPWAKFTFGFNSRLNYKSFDFSMQVTGSVGNKVLLSHYEFTRNMDGPFNVLQDVKNRWRSPQNPGNGIFPTTNYPDQLQYIRLASNMWIADGSHARISNISFGYTLPQQIAQKLQYLKNARVYATIQNAWIISKAGLNNPDASLQNGTLNMGWQRNTYPLARQYSLGVNLSF